MSKSEVFISIQDFSGDTKLKLSWDKNDKDSIKQAREEFIRLKQSGYTIFSVKKILGLFPTKGKEIKRYDPKIGSIYYSKEELDKKDNTFTMEEFVDDVSVNSNGEAKESQNNTNEIKYEDTKLYNPEKEDVATDRDYVATSRLYAG